MPGLAYLIHNIFERIWAINCEADEDEIGFGIRQWPQTIILFLSRRVPERKLQCLPVRAMFFVTDVVLEHGRYVFLPQISAYTPAASF